MFVMWVHLFERLKSVQILTISLLGLEPMPCISVALMAQYLNVRQRKLGTIIIQTVLHHDRADKGRTFSSTSNLLPNNPARQWYRYTSVPMKAQLFEKRSKSY